MLLATVKVGQKKPSSFKGLHKNHLVPDPIGNLLTAIALTTHVVLTNISFSNITTIVNMQNLMKPEIYLFVFQTQN